MIDWLTAVIPLSPACAELDWHQLAGYTLFARPGGEVEKVIDRWLPIKGSYDEAIRCRIGSAGLWLSGNPAKFLSGQNVDGPDDAPALLAVTAQRVCAALSIPSCVPCTQTRLTRVDVTYSLDLGSIERVREVLRLASLTARARHQGRSSTAYQTVYLGQHSRRHSVKLYAKGDETAEHGPRALPADVMRSLRDQADGLLRVEVTVRRQELEEHRLADVQAWLSPSVPLAVWQRYWGRVEINTAMDLLESETLALPRRLRGTYELWRRGADVCELLSKATYYRHRRDLLRVSDGRVDLSILRPAVAGAQIGTENIGAYLHQLSPWKSSGRLAEWIDKTAA